MEGRRGDAEEARESAVNLKQTIKFINDDAMQRSKKR